MIKTRLNLFRNKIILTSNSLSLFEIEKVGQIYCENGHEVIKPLNVSWSGNYKVIFSRKRNPNSSYLKLKRAIEKCKDALGQLNEKESK